MNFTPHFNFLILFPPNLTFILLIFLKSSAITLEPIQLPIMATPPPMRITGLPGLEEAIKNAKWELPLMTRDEIEALIAEGRKIIIVHGQVLKVDPWCKYHPGGDIAILHMVGKDASDEIDAYVNTRKWIKIMKLTQ